MGNPMKMTESHFQYIRSEIGKILARDGIKFKDVVATQASNPRIKDAEKAARWLIFFAARSLSTRKIMRELYDYLNDNHIDTALRNICKEID